MYYILSIPPILNFRPISSIISNPGKNGFMPNGALLSLYLLHSTYAFDVAPVWLQTVVEALPPISSHC